MQLQGIVARQEIFVNSSNIIRYSETWTFNVLNNKKKNELQQ